ncbi:hypothetical protein K9D27_000253 [Salmonella enterica]|nr:hypothetical protein [Salmonella enterica]
MMTHCHTTSTDAPLTGVETLRRVLQQSSDQYPRLVAFLLTLPGILLSECVRLRLDGLYDGLEQVFRYLREPGLRESLTLLCWYELVNGLQNSDWQYLPALSEQEVKKWMETRLPQYPLLYRVVDEYVFFASFGFWSESPSCL